MGNRVPSTHNLIKRLVERVRYTLNKHVVGGDGRSPYGILHGRGMHERICELGEKVLGLEPGSFALMQSRPTHTVCSWAAA